MEGDERPNSVVESSLYCDFYVKVIPGLSVRRSGIFKEALLDNIAQRLEDDRWEAKKVRRCKLLWMFLCVTFYFLYDSPCFATQYEYKILPLGSLTQLQKKSEAKTREIETLLNGQGKDGWEVVNVFAVRTTFDPNVFFVVMKRTLDNEN